MLHRYAADRAGPLAARLAEVLSLVPADPLTPEWLATPSEGMRRWVMLELASHLGASRPGRADGICANVVPALPDSLRRAVLAADGVDRHNDPWSPERMAWPVLGILSDPLACADLGLPLSSDAPRYGVARQVADHFDRYHLHRPAMVRAWAEGRDVDGVGAVVPDDMAWQPRLWRAVRDRIIEPSAPERWPGLLERLRSGTIELDLPPRLLVFGFSLLPTGDFLELLSAVATDRDVHLFLLEPASYDGRRLQEKATAAVGGLRPRADDDSAEVALHPLLRSWGRPQRETAILLADAEARGLPAAERLGGPIGENGATGTLLHHLQSDIRSNRTPTGDAEPLSGDRSVQFHACFGPAHQVAALREAVLHLLADDPELREEDIVVLCPALERFAPLVQTVLGPSAPAADPGGAGRPEHGTAPALRYRLVDQSVRTANDVVEAVLALLDLVSGRFEAPAVVDFLTRPPVRERFGFDEDDVAAIDRWVANTHVCWGLDPAHRARLGVPVSVTSNTWQAALDRLLMGSVVAADDLAIASGPVVPYAIEGGAVSCAGRLADAVSTLSDLAGATATARPVDEWVALVRRSITSLLGAPPETTWQLEVVDRALSDALDAAGGVETSWVPLEWADLRRVLGEHLGARRGRNDFFRGGMTITSLVPLRWVPFRVVCLLGMDQPALTGGSPAGDDLVQAPAVVGDRDPRSDLREALLEAVLAAGDQLLVFRDGRNPRTNQEIPRAVAMAELYESVLDAVRPPLRAEVSRRLEIDHPCHPFDERCFTPDGLVEGTRWGFGSGDLAGARARRDRQKDKPPFLTEPLPPAGTEVIELSDLQAFFDDPTGAFLRQRLGVRVPRRADQPETSLPVALDPLSKWQVGDRLLQARLAGHTYDAWLAHERGLGTLPPGVLGDQLIHDIEQQAEGLVGQAAELGVVTGRLSPVPIDIQLDGGTRIVGTIPQALDPVHPGAACVTFSREKPSQRVRAWLDLMVLSTADPGATWRSVLVCRNDRSEAVAADYVLTVAGTDDDPPAPPECLRIAVTLYRMGMVEPLPVFPKLSYALFNRPTDAPGIWRSPPGSPAPPGEGEHPAVELVHGRCEVGTVLALPARNDDPGQKTESSRARRLARLLYCTVTASMHSQIDSPKKGRRR
jgi:exodeoxyribonuclease V gamma subunit